MGKIVTDSVADIPFQTANELGVTIIPLNVHFGSETYRDGIDLTADDFYRKLQESPILPKTSAPSSGLFAEFFDHLAEETPEIIAVFLSTKFSATYEAALQGIKLMKRKCRVKVINSTLAIMGQGLLVIEAAKKATAGASINEIADIVLKNIHRIHVRSTLDTMKYLAMGGRIGRAQAWLGMILKVNPILGIKGGEAFPFARVRSRKQAIERLYRFTTGFTKVKALAVEYGTCTTEANTLAKRIGSIFPKVPMYISNVNPVIGTHAGPGILSVTVLEEQED